MVSVVDGAADSESTGQSGGYGDPMCFTWWLILGSVLFAGVVALIAAWIPARKAMNISPNEAIRSE